MRLFSKRLQLPRPSVIRSWRSAIWRRSVLLRAVVGSAGPAQLNRDPLGGGRIDLELQNLANLGEFISSVAVILSLVYLAIQVRQNTASIRTENFARALDRVSAMQSLLFENGNLARLQAQGVLDPSTLTREERLQLTWWLLEAFGAFEFMFHQARSGALPDEVWNRWSATTAWWVSFPGVQAWWHARPTPFSESFTSFVDALIRDGAFDSEAANRFNKFLEGTAPRSSSASPAA